ncbi:hypothetical protein K435DRAFT_812150 [Dendrothele bispora CBS 962.96]|uniref:Uncharacterized protein n=1 Tax=Dendrothele bispora (strain CBS 962.96) TaxID=1314807 RepID=A0A4S8KPY0_DENBC|nr:hypothetical protein K435DRAFT_812150 [Dendrothele bispora CBS 962.96]
MFGTISEPTFHQLLCKYLVFEYDQDYKDGKLPPRGRPKPVGDWIARARAPNYLPKVINAVEYQETFVKWYESLQPEWRVQGQDTRWIRNESDSENDWEELCTSGKNGVMNIVAGLYYWYHGINMMKDDGFRAKQAKQAALEEWKYFVDDFTYVLIQMSVQAKSD